MSAAAVEIRPKLAAKYKIANLGTAKQFLGIQITNDDDGIALSRNAFISAILKRFGMEEANERNRCIHFNGNHGEITGYIDFD